MNVIDKYKLMSVCKIKEDVERNSFPYSIMMQHINGDFNISTFIRNGNAFGVKEIFYWGKKKWDRRGAVGAHNYKQLTHLSSEEEILKLKEKYRFIGIENNVVGCKPLKEYIPRENDLLIFGEESSGISENVLRLCDEIIYINQWGTVRSLNVGTSSGIIMNHVSTHFSEIK